MRERCEGELKRKLCQVSSRIEFLVVVAAAVAEDRQ